MRSAQIDHQAPAAHREERAPPRDRRRGDGAAPRATTYAQQVVFEVARDANKIEIRARGPEAVQGHRDRCPHARRARQGEARRSLLRSASVVEEGVRHAQARRQHRVLRGSLRWRFRKYKPTSPGRRGMSTQDFGEITKSEPEKSLLAHKPRPAGRNNHGRITSRFRGGGHKQRYRMVDFKRTKTGVPATVLGDRVRPEPLGAPRAAPVRRRREGATSSRPQQPRGRRPGDRRRTRPTSSPATRCRSATSRSVPTIHAVELKIGRGAQIGRSAGTKVTLMAKEGDWATLRMPSGEMRRVHIDCRATIGQIGNTEHAQHPVGQGRPHAVARHPPAPARRVDEPGRSPDGWWRRSVARVVATRAPRGARRPRASRPVTTSGPSSSSSAAGEQVRTPMPRSVKKGPFVDKYLAKKMAVAAEGGQPDKRVITTYSRRSMVIPDMVGLTFAVHNGRKFIPVFITEQMVGHKLGEFSPHPHVPRPHRRAEEVSHAGTCTRSWHLDVAPQDARRREPRPQQEGRGGRRPARPHAEEGRGHHLQGDQERRGERRGPVGRRRVGREPAHPHDRRRRRHDREALDAALDGPRQPHQPPHQPPHGGRHGRGRRAHGPENTSDRLPPRHHQDVVVSLVRGEELRQVAA